jgi:adenine-specific DNA-methyltransferase
MEKVSQSTDDRVQSNIDAIAGLFPNVVTESFDSDGEAARAIDFDLLRQELADCIVDGARERYQLDWPGKRAAVLAGNAPTRATLRPVRDESVDFDTTKNIFIEGDNLEALKLLQESYLGKVKLIYIDPPYNTGNDFIYDDDFAETTAEYLERSGQTDESGARLVANTESNGRFHSDWLSMMYPRLKLARNLLTADGVLMVSIDESEHANLVRVACEVLGDDSYVGEIVWKNSSKNDQAYISMQHEYLVFFVRNRVANGGNWVEKKDGLDKIYTAFTEIKKKHGDDWSAIHEDAKAWYRQFPPSDPVYASKHYNRMDANGIYFADNISGPNDGQYVYELLHPVTGQPCKVPSRGWVFPKESMDQRIKEARVHFGPDHTTVPNLKTYLAKTEYQSLTSIRFVDGRAASKRLQRLFGEKVFTNPKDELLLRDVYKAVGVSNHDIVLDMFAGSGSAMHAVLALNATGDSACSYIGVQWPEDLHTSLKSAKGVARKVTQNAIDYLAARGLPATVAEICKERMRLVAPDADTLTTDVGFRVLRIDSGSFVDVLRTPDATEQAALDGLAANIKADRSSEDLLVQVMLDWGLPLSLPIECQSMHDVEVWDVDDRGLIACFATALSTELVRSIAERRPVRAVFRDSSFGSDAERINVEQIFREVSKDTQVKVI